ncbi:MAG TPA: TonB family protein [Terracidiphilus sp.]|nr:TonB family protein [Terracidiphilus sp.]
MRTSLVSTLLLGSILFPVAAVASQTKADASLSTTNLRVSTGVVAPAILRTTQVTVPQGVAYSDIPEGAQVGLLLTVDKNGAPEDIQVVRSLNASWDASVVSAVRQFRFRPGTIDNQPIPVDVNLTVTIAR